jgi:tRNA-dihydrouridine synthase B
MFQVGHIRLERPLLLAPMEDVTERPFRRLCRRHGADLVYTEFVNSEGLIRAAAKTRAKIALAEDEHPVGIQLYGNKADSLVEAAIVSEAVGPDLIDLNFGCPAKKVACKKDGVGAGAGLLREPNILVGIARAVVRAVSLPVTVKTRLGWDDNSIIIEDLARRLEDTGIAALTLHARTRCQGFKGQADWSWIARVKQVVRIPVIGNGDVREPADAARMFAETGCDAVMIGRGAMGNPWLFRRTRAVLNGRPDPGPPSLEERVAVYLDILDTSVADKGEPRGVYEMRKFLSGYLKEVYGIRVLRNRIMQESTREGVRARIGEFVRWVGGGPAGWEPGAPEPGALEPVCKA